MSAAGFGIGAEGQGFDPEAKQRHPLPPGGPEQVMAEDIHAIKTRYVQPKVWDPQIFGPVAANATVKVDRSQTTINLLQIAVPSSSAGSVRAWIGDYTGGGQPLVGHFEVGPGVTQQFMIPPGLDYVFTLQAIGGIASFCVTTAAL
jgi:hypothetical protein